MALRAAMVAIATMTDPALSRPVQRTGAEERDYLVKRAEHHRRLAVASSDPGSRSLHMRFQQLYLERASAEHDGTFEPDPPAKIPGTGISIDG
jgi:hypothetical protein